MSEITRAYAVYKGQQYNASYDSGTQLWDVDIPSGSESSYSQSNHTYPIELHAFDAAGNETIMYATDPTYGDQLNIRVLEKTKPTATIVSPTQDSVLGSATQDIVMELQDAGGSGLNMASVIFKVNNVQVSTGLTWSDGAGGKKTCTYHATNLSDGSNSVSLQVTDNDGNVSDVATVSFVISTSAPTLNVTSPTEGLLTNSNKVTVAGTAAAGSDAVTLSSVKINGETVTVGSGGAFSKEITLEEGDNTITVVAEDSIGKTTTVTRHVTVDTQAPIISDVEAEATTVDANGTIQAAAGKNAVACWSTVLEKAIMKWNAIYKVNPDINGIGTEVVAPLFTGNGSSFAFDRGVLENEDLARAVRVSLWQGKIIVGGFHPGDIPVDGSKTVSGHAYTLMHSADKSALFTMRNPWGGNPDVDGSADGVLNIPDDLDVAPTIDLRIVEPGKAAQYGTGVTEAYIPPAFAPGTILMCVSPEVLRYSGR